MKEHVQDLQTDEQKMPQNSFACLDHAAVDQQANGDTLLTTLNPWGSKTAKCYITCDVS